MQNQMLGGTTIAKSNPWTNPLAAISVMLVPPYDRSASQLPNVKKHSQTRANPVGTVVLLLQDASLAAELRLLLTARNVEVRNLSTAREIFAVNESEKPACLVVDLDFENGSGLLLCEQIKTKGWRLPVIALSGGCDFRVAVRAMHTGVEDVLTKPPGVAEFLDVIERALVKSINVRKGLTQAEELRHRFEELSSREREIVKLVLAGLMNKEIAVQLQLALVTIKMHRGKLMRKLGARNAADLVRIALAAEFVRMSRFNGQAPGSDEKSDAGDIGRWDAGTMVLA